MSTIRHSTPSTLHTLHGHRSHRPAEPSNPVQHQPPVDSLETAKPAPLVMSPPQPLLTNFDDASLARLQQLGQDRGQPDFANFVAGLRDKLQQQGGLSLLDETVLVARLALVFATPAQPPPTTAPAAPAAQPTPSPAPGLTAAARELQLSVSELKDQLAAGLSLNEIAQRRGISADTVRYAVRNELAAARPDLANTQLDNFTDGVMSHRADPLPEGSPQRQALAAAATELQMPVSELNDALARGVSLTELAQQRGVSLESVRYAVRNGLASDRPELSNGQLDAYVDGIMNRRADPLKTPAPGTLNAAAQELQLSPTELNDQLRSGLSLADLALHRGISLDAVTYAVRNGLAADRPGVLNTALDQLTDGVMNHRADPALALAEKPAPSVPASRMRPFIAP